MTTYTFQELLDRLRQGDESVEIEAKPGNTISHSTLQTVSALSNEPGGGGTSQSEGLQSLSEGLPTLSEGSTGPPGGLSESLPPDLQETLKSLGKRAQPDEVKNIIVQLCAWRSLRLAQLAALLSRNPEYIRGEYVYPLVQNGRLEYTIPCTPAHPQQAYRAPEMRQGEQSR